MPTGRAHYRVTFSDAISAHERALWTGGREGIVDESLIRAAIERPYTGYRRWLRHKAAALIEAVALNHGFIDGNKRTAIFLTNLLLERSGYTLEPIDERENLDAALEELVIAIVEHRVSFDEVAEWFGARIRPFSG